MTYIGAYERIGFSDENRIGKAGGKRKRLKERAGKTRGKCRRNIGIKTMKSKEQSRENVSAKVEYRRE